MIPGPTLRDAEARRDVEPGRGTTEAPRLPHSQTVAPRSSLGSPPSTLWRWRQGLLAGTAAMLSLAVAVADGDEGRPLAQHPDNPHYLIYRGRPLIPIGSGEHYGAVLNLDFDYRKYLDELASKGLTHTRTFSGVYCEPQGAFRIAANTLAPAPGRLLAPWARSAEPGYAGGGNRFDLTRWNPAYFERLEDFVAQAERRGIIVECVLFCPFYRDEMWKLSPMNAANNVNGIGQMGREAVYTLDRHGGLLAVHEQVTRQIVQRLNAYDNVYYEICNEPYFGGVTEAWERHITDIIVQTEKSLPQRHLISHNIANGSAKVGQPHPAAAILNFHYASPPTAVSVNAALGRVIGLNETGFKGTGDAYYRRESWQFLLAGGGLYSHLDYSFAVGHEDGSFPYPPTQPGGGNEAYRTQMRVLSQFLHALDFVRMRPANELVRVDGKQDRAQVLAEPGKQYAVYLDDASAAHVEITLPPGDYEAEWIDVLSGQSRGRRSLSHAGGVARLTAPNRQLDIALRVTRAPSK